MLEEAGRRIIMVVLQPLEYQEALVVVDRVVLEQTPLLILDPQVPVENLELLD